ncbi:hypothetical protein LP416_26100 [Polaromonas sp. P2-4]|nr:hypothetical protein LP416_26100 [Polaromonas sp. P2-4]
MGRIAKRSALGERDLAAHSESLSVMFDSSAIKNAVKKYGERSQQLLTGRFAGGGFRVNRFRAVRRTGLRRGIHGVIATGN